MIVEDELRLINIIYRSYICDSDSHICVSGRYVSTSTSDTFSRVGDDCRRSTYRDHKGDRV